jgi:hypothetical protein
VSIDILVLKIQKKRPSLSAKTIPPATNIQKNDILIFPKKSSQTPKVSPKNTSQILANFKRPFA